MSDYASYTATVTLKDGSTATHTAEALEYRHVADGAIAVRAACCVGTDGGLDSWHTFYDIARPTADGLIDPEAEVRAHVQRVAEHHAAAHRVRSFNLDGLMKPKPVQPSAPSGGGSAT